MTPARGTCLSKCPFGYYLDVTNSSSHICKPCASPCATCDGSATKCSSCDGSPNAAGDPRYFVNTLDNKCYDTCPDFTSADMTNQRCLGCKARCKRCTDTETCTLCQKPFLLQDGDCVEKCTKPGYFPNGNKTLCINQVEVPFMGPLWTYITAPTCIAIVASKYVIKETEALPTMIAFVGLTEFLAIFTQIILAAMFAQDQIIACAIISFIVLIVLNIYNYYYINKYVISVDAMVDVKIKRDDLEKLMKKWKKKKDSRFTYWKERVAIREKNKGSSLSVALEENLEQ